MPKLYGTLLIQGGEGAPFPAGSLSLAPSPWSGTHADLGLCRCQLPLQPQLQLYPGNALLLAALLGR